MSRKPILILFAHPAFEKSRVNRQLVQAVQNIEGVTFHDLYELYPDFGIDIKIEQDLLENHETIVFHHPFYWYSAPALLKEWQDLVLEQGWAYGDEGSALRGKLLLSMITTGAREDTYQQTGFNRYTIAELLAPFNQMAHLCKMTYLPPFVVHGTHKLTAKDIDNHAQAYRRIIIALRDSRLDLKAASNYPRMNSQLDKVIAE